MTLPREPYRATKLWLEAVAIFRKGVPIGKNTRLWKTYEESFISSEAITWFHAQLREKLEPAITRKQTLALLQKFYKSGIFIPANSTSAGNGKSFSLTSIKETDFKDNDKMYRLVGWDNNSSVSCKQNENPKENTVVKSPPKLQMNYSVITKPLHIDDVNKIWTEVFIERFSLLIGTDVLSTFFDSKIIQGEWIAHNSTKMGKNGVVYCLNSSDDLPPWLLNAMKCLANWPSNHAYDSGLPSYPNFENDVFKLISEYFITWRGGLPLLTYDLYSAFITCFIRAELFDFNARLYSMKTLSASRSHLFQSDFNSTNNQFQKQNPKRPPYQINALKKEIYPFSASDSVENLLIGLVTPKAHQSKQERGSIKPKRILGACPEQDENIISPMPVQEISTDKYKSPFYFETAFTDGSPITRVVSATELKNTLPRIRSGISSQGSSSSNSRHTSPASNNTSNDYYSCNNYQAELEVAEEVIENDDYVYENPNLELSASDIIHHPKYARAYAEFSSCTYNAPPSISFCDYSSPSSSEDSSYNLYSANGGIKDIRCASAMNLSDNVRDRSPYYTPASIQSNDWFGFGNNGMTRRTVNNSIISSRPASYVQAIDSAGVEKKFSNYRNECTPESWRGELRRRVLSNSKICQKTLDFYYGADAVCSGLMTVEGKQLAILSFRMLTLLLPPANRRHLQLLLRCMSKMAKNDKLMLDVAMSTRAIIINTFFRTILSCKKDSEFDELLALRIVTFLMDNDSEIFANGQETSLVDQVQETLFHRQITKVPVAQPQQKLNTSPSENFVENKENVQLDNLMESGNFCKRITLDEYENERLLSMTSKALRDLLSSIVENRSLNDKEKRKRLKQFKEEYPHIYKEKFGEEDELLQSLTISIKEEKKEKNPIRRFFRMIN